MSTFLPRSPSPPSPSLFLLHSPSPLTHFTPASHYYSLSPLMLEIIRTRNSIAIWREYIAWLLESGDQRAAKQVFYRAIRYLPWAKKVSLVYLPLYSSFPKNTTLMQVRYG